MKKTLVLFLILLSGLMSGYLIVNTANIVVPKGLSSKPLCLYPYSGFTNETFNAIMYSCSEWTRAGRGTLIYLSSTTHNNTTFSSVSNNRSEVTKQNQGNTGFQAITRTYLNSTNKITEADINLNVYYPFGSAYTSFDTQDVMTHEVGHALGLGDIIVPNGETMYYYSGPGNTYRRTIDTDDIAGIQAIY